VKPGEKLVVTAGVPFGTPGNTNVLRIAQAVEGGDAREISLVR
jgi:hypothetical protein